jgi:hypothetical protein
LDLFAMLARGRFPERSLGLAAVVSAAALCLPLTAAMGPALAQPKDAAVRVPRPAATAGSAMARTAAAAEQKRRELEDLRREDVAAQLALLGLPLVWQEHSLAELLDWRDRIEAAVTLRVQHRVQVDWRLTSLADLNDMRLRASKAAELATQYGVRVDWRQYSWPALESMRRQVARLHPTSGASAFADDALAAPGSVGVRRRLGHRPVDPDAIIAPTFAFDTPLVWARPSGRRRAADPDAILVPAFVTAPSHPLER